MPNNLTLSGASFGSGRFGQALAAGFGAAPAGLPSGLPFSIGAWVKTTATTTQVAVGASHLASSPPYFAWYVGTSPAGKPIANVGGGSADLVGASTVNDGAWHYLQLDCSVSGSVFSVDGVQQASNSVACAILSDGVLGIGNFGTPGQSATNYPFAGSIDEVSVFSAVRTPAMPSAPLTGTEASLAALWHLDGNGSDSKGVAPLGPLVLGFVGDSITQGTNGDGVGACAAYLSGLGYAVSTVNRGVGGSSSADWTPDGSLLAPALAAMQGAGVTDVMVMLGTNDARTPNGFTAAQHVANMAQVVGGLVAGGLRVVLNKPIWTMPNSLGTWPADPNTFYRDYYAADLRLVDGTNVFQGDTGAHQAFRLGASLLGDGVHPASQAANDVLGQYWATGFLHRMGAGGSGAGRGTPHIGGGIS